MTAARMAARPVTPTVAHATAVNTTAAHASSSPPSTYSTFCTVRVDVSGPAGRAGGAVEAGAAGATKAAARIRADTRAARSLRRRRTSSNRFMAAVYACRRASASARSVASTPSRRTTSAASGSGGRPQPAQPAVSSAGAWQYGHGYVMAPQWTAGPAAGRGSGTRPG